MKLQLENKIVLICGGSSGLGLDIAQKFLIEGSKIIIISNNKKKLIRAKKKLYKETKSNIEYFKCNFEDFSDVKILSHIIKKKFSRVDVLVFCIGSGKGSKSHLISNKVFYKSWSKNFLSFKNCFDSFSNLIKRYTGSMTVISSIAGMQYIGASVEYTISKNSLNMFCKIYSKKIQNKFRLNVISPGNILQKGNSWYKKIKNNKNIVQNYINKNVPLKKFARPENISNFVVFLSSNKGSFFHGSNIVIDGGQLDVY